MQKVHESSLPLLFVALWHRRGWRLHTPSHSRCGEAKETALDVGGKKTKKKEKEWLHILSQKTPVTEIGSSTLNSDNQICCCSC